MKITLKSRKTAEVEIAKAEKGAEVGAEEATEEEAAAEEAAEEAGLEVAAKEAGAEVGAAIEAERGTEAGVEASMRLLLPQLLRLRQGPKLVHLRCILLLPPLLPLPPVLPPHPPPLLSNLNFFMLLHTFLFFLSSSLTRSVYLSLSLSLGSRFRL